MPSFISFYIGVIENVIKKEWKEKRREENARIIFNRSQSHISAAIPLHLLINIFIYLDIG